MCFWAPLMLPYIIHANSHIEIRKKLVSHTTCLGMHLRDMLAWDYVIWKEKQMHLISMLAWLGFTLSIINYGLIRIIELVF
jgi:hypothetical protein